MENYQGEEARQTARWDSLFAHKTETGMASILEARFQLLEYPPYSLGVAINNDHQLFLRSSEDTQRQKIGDYSPAIFAIKTFSGSSNNVLF